MTDKPNINIVRTAKKYAEALFDVAKEKNAVETIQNDLNLISDTIAENEELNDFLNNPVISQSDKKDVVKQLFEDKISETTMNLMYLLADNSRFETIYEIKQKIGELKDEASGIVKVKVTSAVDMKDYLKEKLVKKLESKLSKQVKVEYRINTEIVAGLIVEIEGKTIDNSIATKLKNIKKQLI